MIDPAAQSCEIQELSTYWFVIGTMVGVLVVLIAIVLTDRR
jgi:hypothetical protein